MYLENKALNKTKNIKFKNLFKPIKSCSDCSLVKILLLLLLLFINIS
jgi:hypothetical protein